MTHVNRRRPRRGSATRRPMSRVSAPAVRGTLLGALLRLWNPLMRRLIDSPVHWPLSRWFAVLAWTGCKTGRRYSTPVSYVREGRTAYVTTGDRWWRNLTGGAPVVVRIAGRWREGTAAPLTDPADCRAEHERLFREHSWFRRLAGIPNGPERRSRPRCSGPGGDGRACPGPHRARAGDHGSRPPSGSGSRGDRAGHPPAEQRGGVIRDILISHPASAIG